MAASLSGRSGGHPIGIVLLKKDIPDVWRIKKDRREGGGRRRLTNLKKNARLVRRGIPYAYGDTAVTAFALKGIAGWYKQIHFIFQTNISQNFGFNW